MTDNVNYFVYVPNPIIQLIFAYLNKIDDFNNYDILSLRITCRAFRNLTSSFWCQRINISNILPYLNACNTYGFTVSECIDVFEEPFHLDYLLPLDSANVKTLIVNHIDLSEKTLQNKDDCLKFKSINTLIYRNYPITDYDFMLSVPKTFRFQEYENFVYDKDETVNAFGYAIQFTDVKLMEVLVKTGGYDPNAPCCKFSIYPLILACKICKDEEDEDVIDYLLKCNVDLESKDIYGRTAIYYAKYNILLKLFKAGANFTDITDSQKIWLLLNIYKNRDSFNKVLQSLKGKIPNKFLRFAIEKGNSHLFKAMLNLTLVNDKPVVLNSHLFEQPVFILNYTHSDDGIDSIVIIIDNQIGINFKIHKLNY
jgi:hypothetical protein